MRKKHSAGFALIEVLVAAALLAVVGTSVYMGIAQAVRANRAIRETNALHDPLKLLWMRLGKDLKSSVAVRNYPFVGKTEASEFVVRRAAGRPGETDVTPVLAAVRYSLKDGSLMRSERRIPKELTASDASAKAVLNGVQAVRFSYAYLDEEEKSAFESSWPEEPYYGIPKAVRVDIRLKKSDRTFSRIFLIPQGKWGHYP